MKKFTLLSLITIFTFISCGQKNMTFDYTAICNGIGAKGIYLVKIFTIGNVKKAREKSRVHAVHAALFKGIAGSGMCQSQKPICNISYSEKKDWFNNFFESGDYLQYVSFSDNGYIDGNDVVKLPKGGKKIGIAVSISVNALRKRMEKEGFARALSQGF